MATHNRDKAQGKRGKTSPTQRALAVFVPPSDTDVNGSYTGRPKHADHPVQDADDL